MQSLIIIRGYPGSGKTTVGKRLETRKLGTFIDHNRILTFIAQFTKNDDGIYDEISQLELAMVKKLINDGKSVIVARGFSSVRAIAPYVAIAKEYSIAASIVRLNVIEEELLNRVQAPERKQDFNPTTSKDALRSWVQDNPLVPYSNEIQIDANEPIDTVMEQIVRQLSA